MLSAARACPTACRRAVGERPPPIGSRTLFTSRHAAISSLCYRVGHDVSEKVRDIMPSRRRSFQDKIGTAFAGKGGRRAARRCGAARAVLGPHKKGRRSDDKWNGARTRPDAGTQAPKAGLSTSLQAGSPARRRRAGLSRSEPSSRSPRKAIWRLCRAGACSEHSALPSARPRAAEPFPPPTGIGGLPTSLQAGRSRPSLLGPNSR